MEVCREDDLFADMEEDEDKLKENETVLHDELLTTMYMLKRRLSFLCSHFLCIAFYAAVDKPRVAIEQLDTQ